MRGAHLLTMRVLPCRPLVPVLQNLMIPMLELPIKIRLAIPEKSAVQDDSYGLQGMDEDAVQKNYSNIQDCTILKRASAGHDKAKHDPPEIIECVQFREVLTPAWLSGCSTQN